MHQDILLIAINEIRIDSGQPELERITPDQSLRSDIGFDSLDLALLTVKIEAACGVDVFSEGLVATVGEVRERIERR